MNLFGSRGDVVVLNTDLNMNWAFDGDNLKIMANEELYFPSTSSSQVGFCFDADGTIHKM